MYAQCAHLYKHLGIAALQDFYVFSTAQIILQLFVITSLFVIVTTIKGRLSTFHCICNCISWCFRHPPSRPHSKWCRHSQASQRVWNSPVLVVASKYWTFETSLDHALPGLFPLDLDQDTSLQYDEACYVSALCALLNAIYLDGN